MGKRGLSSIVTSLIIILLVLVAIAVIWVVIRNIIESGSEEISLGQFNLNLKIREVKIDGDLEVSVERNPGSGDLTGIKFVIETNTKTKSIEKREIDLQELGQKTFTFGSAELGIPLDDITKVSIAPIYKTAKGTEKIGSILGTYSVKEGEYSVCTNTCASLGYNCGTQSICGVAVDCGTCDDGKICVDGTCVPEVAGCTVAGDCTGSCVAYLGTVEACLNDPELSTLPSVSCISNLCMCTGCLGDMNNDGIIDDDDASIIGAMPGVIPTEDGWNPRADTNCDNKINFFDMSYIGGHRGEECGYNP